MTAFKTTVSALALVALAAGGIGVATLIPASVEAQTTQTAPASPDHAKAATEHRRFDPAERARFVEGRIAFMKTVLKITPAQEPAFNGLADAMRANFKERSSAFEQWRTNREQPKSAVERLEMRIKVTKMREASQERVLTALKPLYASFTPEQKKLADNLVGGHHHWRGMHEHHRG